jgi:hypothetical protein
LPAGGNKPPLPAQGDGHFYRVFQLAYISGQEYAVSRSIASAVKTFYSHRFQSADFFHEAAGQ